jgi:hypothetical protein
MSLTTSSRLRCRGALLSEHALHHRFPPLSPITHVITCTPPYLAGDPMTATYPLSPLSNLAGDRSTNRGKARFTVASLTARVVAELLRRVVGSTCEILLLGFGGKELRAMKLPHRITLRRRIMDGQTNLAGKVASAGAFSNRLNWIWCRVLSLNLMRESQVTQMLLPK